MRVFSSLEEVLGAAGAELGVSPYVLVDQGRIDRFAEATDDHQWIHTDAQRAARGPYGGTIAHGFLTLSLIPGLLQQVVSYAFDPVRVNYGIDRVRFLAPVPVGSRLRDTIRIDSVTPTGSGARVVFGHVVEFEGGTRPAALASTISLLVVESA